MAPDREHLMYRPELFKELVQLAGKDLFAGSRILEIGPKDGLDSKRLAALSPEELVIIDLPEKREGTKSWLDEVNCPHR